MERSFLVKEIEKHYYEWLETISDEHAFDKGVVTRYILGEDIGFIRYLEDIVKGNDEEEEHE